MHNHCTSVLTIDTDRNHAGNNTACVIVLGYKVERCLLFTYYSYGMKEPNIWELGFIKG